MKIWRMRKIAKFAKVKMEKNSCAITSPTERGSDDGLSLFLFANKETGGDQRNEEDIFSAKKVEGRVGFI